MPERVHAISDDTKHKQFFLVQVRARLAEGPGLKARKQLENLLQHAARGIATNPTANLEHLLVLVHTTLQHGLAAEARSLELSQANPAGEMPEHEQGGPSLAPNTPAGSLCSMSLGLCTS